MNDTSKIDRLISAAESELRDLEVKRGATTKHNFEFAYGELRVTCRAPSGGSLVCDCSILEVDTETVVKEGGDCKEGFPFKLLPGVYDLKCSAGDEKKEKIIRGIEITAGEITTQDVYLE